MGCEEDGFGYCVSEGEKKRCLSTTLQLHSHTHSSDCGGAALFCLPCLEKEGEQVTVRERERKKERELSVLR